MKKRFPILVLFVFVLFIESPNRLGAQNFQNILVRVDSLAGYTDTDFSAVYTFINDRPGIGRDTTVSAVFRRDVRETYTIIVMEPSLNKGQGYLKQGRTLWFYDPDSRRFNSTSSKDRFQNSHARNSDFTSSTLARDYRVSSGERTQLGRFSCWKLQLEALTDEVTYPLMTIWVDDEMLIRKAEDYSLSGQLLRTTAFPRYENVEGYFVPSRILIIDELKGANIDGEFVNEKTQISISRVSMDNLPDNIFTKAFLENMGQ